MRGWFTLVLALVASSARGQGAGLQQFRAYYAPNQGPAPCSGGPGYKCSIVECDAAWSCSCLSVLPNGWKQPLSDEQCLAASRMLPLLPPDALDRLDAAEKAKRQQDRAARPPAAAGAVDRARGEKRQNDRPVASGVPEAAHQGEKPAQASAPSVTPKPATRPAKEPPKKKSCFCICGDPKGPMKDRKAIGHMREDQCPARCVWDHHFPEGMHTCL